MPTSVLSWRQFSGPVLALALSPICSTPLAADARSTELMRYACSSSLARRDITLFANGTVRLRQGPLDEQSLFLDELLPEELASYLKRLNEVLSSSWAPPPNLPTHTPSGEWTEDCEISVALPDSEPARFGFSPYEIPPLVVAGLIHLAEDLADFTRTPEQVDRLPDGYRPRPGDVLRTSTDGRFRVVGMTTDGRGVELEEVDSPLMIMVPIDELREAFSVLEEPGLR